MAHINGRQQRQLSKAKDYKKKYGCGSAMGPGPDRAQWRRQTRRKLNRPVDLMRDFHCHNTLDCVCPACNNDDLWTHYVTDSWGTSDCNCGGAGPLTIAIHKMKASARSAEIEPLLRRLFGAAVKTEIRLEQSSAGYGSYICAWIPSHRIEIHLNITDDPET